MLKFGFIITLTFSFFLLNGQVSSQLGRFSTEYVRACAPYTIHLTSEDDFGNVSRSYTYETGLNSTTDTFYTYTVPGNYEIVQLIGATIDQNADTLKIEILEAIPPTFQFSQCDGSSIYLEITDQLYDNYDVILNGDTSFVESMEVGNTFNIVDGSQNLNVQGHFLESFDNCGLSSATIIASPLANSIEINDFSLNYVCADTVSLSMDYQNSGNTTYEIEVRTGLDYDKIYEGILNSDSISLDLIPIQTNTTEICFRLNALSKCDGTRILGEEICTELDNEQELFRDAYASYNDQDIIIHFANNPNGVFTLNKSSEDIPINQFEGISNGFVDNQLSFLRNYQYELSFEAACGSSASVILTPPFIRAEKTNPNQYKITWIDPSNELNEVWNYDLVTSDLSFQESRNEALMSPEENTINITSSPSVDQLISIFQWNSDSTVFISSNPIPLTFEYVIYVPDAFTPNGDGINDDLRIYGVPEGTYFLQVFNRWGEQVYQSDNPNQFWNGESDNGEKLSGTHAYKIEFSNSEGELFSQEGSFVILK